MCRSASVVTDGEYSNMQAFLHTGNGDMSPYVIIDLQVPYAIDYIQIMPRMFNSVAYFRGTNIKVSLFTTETQINSNSNCNIRFML